MRKGIGIAAAVAAGVLVSSLNASALVLVDKSEEQKLRSDAQECTLATGTAVAPANAKGKFVADIAKCDGKINYLKKAKTLTATTGYTAIGCPGDSVSGGADDPFADMTAYQAGALGSTKTQIDGLALTLGVVSGCGAKKLQ